MKKGIVVEFKVKSCKEFKDAFNKINKEFHELYYKCDECLENSLCLYKLVDNGSLVVSDKHKFCLLHLILNIITEKAKEEKYFDISDKAFFQVYYELANKYASTNDDVIRLLWLETKTMSLMDIDISDAVISRYKKIEKYFKAQVKTSKIDDIVINYKNLCEVQKELGVYCVNENLSLAELYISKAVIGYINLYIDNNITINTLKSICESLNLGACIEGLVNQLLERNEIAL